MYSGPLIQQYAISSFKYKDVSVSFELSNIWVIGANNEINIVFNSAVPKLKIFNIAVILYGTLKY